MKLFVTWFFGISSMIFFWQSQCQMPPQKIIVHLDINKTMIAEDPAGKKTAEGILNAELAEKTESVWGDELTEPMSYNRYVEDFLFPGKKGDRDLKNKRYEKTSSFVHYLKEVNHPCFNEVSKKYEALHKILQSHPKRFVLEGENGWTVQKGIIFLSCYELITQLRKQNKQHAIVLRTFGHDLDRVMKELNDEFPDFFGWRGSFQDGLLTMKSLHSKETHVLKDAEELYQFLKNKEGHFALEDDFTRWNKNGETSEYGKLFPIDPNDESVVTFFADDNGDDGIINPPSCKNK